MKKGLLLLALTTLTLVSCGGGNSTEQEKDASGNTIVKIMFHVNKTTAEGKAYQKRIEAFNNAYKEEKIKAVPRFEARTSDNKFEQTLINMKVEGTLPDIITFDAPNCASYAYAEILSDISGQISQDERNDFLSLNEYNGKVYGLPIQESSAGFYYNKNLFARAGVDVSGYTVDNPWTFDQFKAVCQQLKNSGITPVDMRITATGDETATYLLYSFIHAAGGDFVSKDGFTATGHFNSAETKSGFSYLASLISSGYTSYAIGPTDFFNGTVGMYLSSGWTIDEFRDYTTNFPDRNSWGLLPYPQGTAKASATGSWSYGVTDNGVADKSATYKLLKWMSSAESTTVVTNATGMIPSRKSCNPTYEVGSAEWVLLEQLSKTGKERPATVCYPKFSQCFGRIIDSLSKSNLSEIIDGQTNELQKLLNERK